MRPQIYVWNIFTSRTYVYVMNRILKMITNENYSYKTIKINDGNKNFAGRNFH